jgi:hypothetical protein
MNFLGLISSPVIDALEFQRDIQEWLRYLLRVTIAYPLRFAVAAGLILLICGLLVFGLAAGAKREQRAGDWMVVSLRARRRQAIIVSLFCVMGIALGLQFARFTVLNHSATPKLAVPSPGNPIDQIKVWEDPHHGVYHCPGSAWFGKTSAGKVATLRQAQYDGFRPYAKPCPLDQTPETQSSRH